MDAAGLTAGVHTTHSSGELGGGGPANANTMYNTAAGYVATNTGPSIVEMSEWDETKVASWVSTLPRLQPYAQCFIDHQIEGKLFVRLEESMLREMGIDKIGPRARILEELARLKAAARRARREAAVWESNEWDGRSGCQKLYHCNCMCPLQLDHYKLTSAYLMVRRTHVPQCFCLQCGCMGRNQRMNNMDLSQIKDVDLSSNEDGCLCFYEGFDMLRVSTEGGDQDDIEVMKVEPRHGNDIQSMIRNAIEENQIQAMVRV
jgi:hypothetical protein